MKLLFLVMITFILNETTHLVSWYGGKFHGRKTASGEIYDMNQFTCAATKEYKFGDSLEVTNVRNGKSVVVVVNDRGDFKRLGRTLDLSKAAFNQIANLERGVIKVQIKKIE